MAATERPTAGADAASDTDPDARSGPSSRPRGGSGTSATGTNRGHDPSYALPLIGPLIEQADRFRSQLPIGPTWNKSEAEVLRAEAKALRAVANYLEARAKQLDRLQRQGEGEKPRVRRMPVG